MQLASTASNTQNVAHEIGDTCLQKYLNRRLWLFFKMRRVLVRFL